MKLNSFQKTAITTVLATIFLIFVGGLVRSTGAGMGCPDWPKCFGQWVPPTSVSELPEDYKKVYLNQRIEKNEKVARYLNTLGFDQVAIKIKDDPKIRLEQEFNAKKTWIEYVNRLVGVLIGLLIIATTILSFRYRKEKPSIFYSSVAALLLVIFQGWLGSIVVSTNLLPGMISLHMILAMIIVNVLLYAAFKASENFVQLNISDEAKNKLFVAGLVILILSLVQMVLGTQVREEVDIVKEIAPGVLAPRSEWVTKLGSIFEIHRTFSWALVLSGGYLGFLIYKEGLAGQIKRIAFINVWLIAIQLFVGIGLAYLDMPKSLQVLHLVGIALMICCQFLMLMMLKTDKKEALS